MCVNVCKQYAYTRNVKDGVVSHISASTTLQLTHIPHKYIAPQLLFNVCVTTI